MVCCTGVAFTLTYAGANLGAWRLAFPAALLLARWETPLVISVMPAVAAATAAAAEMDAGVCCCWVATGPWAVLVAVAGPHMGEEEDEGGSAALPKGAEAVREVRTLTTGAALLARCMPSRPGARWLDLGPLVASSEASLCAE